MEELMSSFDKQFFLQNQSSNFFPITSNIKILAARLRKVEVHQTF